MFDMTRVGGGLIFVIGMVGRDPKGAVIPGIVPQTARSLERIEEQLQPAGRCLRRGIARPAHPIEQADQPQVALRQRRVSVQRVQHLVEVVHCRSQAPASGGQERTVQ